METIWFILVALMLTAYVVLDGFDLGVGIVAPLVAKGHEQRRLVLRSIGPVWDGNEVWLLAAGGALFFAFPLLWLTFPVLVWLIDGAAGQGRPRAVSGVRNRSVCGLA